MYTSLSTAAVHPEEVDDERWKREVKDTRACSLVPERRERESTLKKKKSKKKKKIGKRD